MKTLLTLTAILIILSSCGETGLNANGTHIATQQKADVETFEEFNTRFHTDSAFQISRLYFPLAGHQIDGFEKRGWTLENWQMMKAPVGASVDTFEFKRHLEKTDSSITEEIWVKESGFRIERTFKLRENKWYLTAYNDINI